MPRVNYESMTITSNGSPSDEALDDFYDVLIRHLISEYGINNVRIVFNELASKYEDS